MPSAKRDVSTAPKRSFVCVGCTEKHMVCLRQTKHPRYTGEQCAWCKQCTRRRDWGGSVAVETHDDKMPYIYDALLVSSARVDWYTWITLPLCPWCVHIACVADRAGRGHVEIITDRLCALFDGRPALGAKLSDLLFRNL